MIIWLSKVKTRTPATKRQIEAKKPDLRWYSCMVRLGLSSTVQRVLNPERSGFQQSKTGTVTIIKDALAAACAIQGNRCFSDCKFIFLCVYSGRKRSDNTENGATRRILYSTAKKRCSERECSAISASPIISRYFPAFTAVSVMIGQRTIYTKNIRTPYLKRSCI